MSRTRKSRKHEKKLNKEQRDWLDDLEVLFEDTRVTVTLKAKIGYEVYHKGKYIGIVTIVDRRDK